MMVLSALRPDASVVEYLEHRARSVSIVRLAAQAIVAFAFVTGGFGRLTFARPVVGTLAGVFFCYAVWGLLDRARSHYTTRGWRLTAQILRILCALFVGLGVLSGLGLILAIWFVALGSAWVL
jgi:hypothetical protein